jgi:undecaprenyl diphosphate synthase
VAHNLRFRPIGRIDQLEPSVQRELARAVEATAACTGALIQIALNYSGRQELVEVARAAARQGQAGLEPDAIDESWVDGHLFTHGTPDPDLMIRTSGEQRISNFLLWQLAYAEIYFCPVLWPDFSTKDLLQAIVEYQRRERRYGGLPSASSSSAPSTLREPHHA